MFTISCVNLSWSLSSFIKPMHKVALTIYHVLLQELHTSKPVCVRQIRGVTLDSAVLIVIKPVFIYFIFPPTLFSDIFALPREKRLMLWRRDVPTWCCVVSSITNRDSRSCFHLRLGWLITGLGFHQTLVWSSPSWRKKKCNQSVALHPFGFVWKARSQNKVSAFIQQAGFGFVWTEINKSLQRGKKKKVSYWSCQPNQNIQFAPTKNMNLISVAVHAAINFITALLNGCKIYVYTVQQSVHDH